MLLSLACFIPLVNTMCFLMKLSQSHDISICDFMQVVKFCLHELARLFVDASTAYSKEDFPKYHDLVTLQCPKIPLQWRELPGNLCISHLLFNLSINEVYTRCHDKATRQHIFVTQQEFYRIQDTVERQFSSTIFHFQIFFPNFFWLCIHLSFIDSICLGFAILLMLTCMFGF